MASLVSSTVHANNGPDVSEEIDGSGSSNLDKPDDNSGNDDNDQESIYEKTLFVRSNAAMAMTSGARPSDPEQGDGPSLRTASTNDAHWSR